jgi:hypothetical protein
MDYCNRNVRRRGGKCAARGFNRRLVRGLSRDDDETRASGGSERLAPRTGWEKALGTGPRVRVDEQHISVSSGSAMLKGVVKNHDVRSPRDRLSDPTRAI